MPKLITSLLLTYAAKDNYSANAITGTSYYQAAGLPATTTAITNVQPNVQYTYWVNNATNWYVTPVTFSAQTGSQNVVAIGYANGSGSITGYDTNNHQTTTSGAYNTTLGANGNAYEQFTYTGTAKQSSGPFGGLMVLEYNNTLSQVTCSGNDILPAGSANPYHLVYQTNNISHTYQEWVYTSGFDTGMGTLQTINCQFNNGNTAVPTGDNYKITFYPANYYVANTGNIVLDTSQYLNGVNTLTSLNQPSSTFYWTT